MKRSVLFDTETTGLDPLDGHRVIEFAALELRGDLPTGRHLHLLIHPERDIPEDATRVHGLTLERLREARRFHQIVHEIRDFFADDPLVAHNAPFDFGFMDAEFSLCGHPALDRARMVDTLALARARFVGMPNGLDALCRRFGIDLSERTTHNALLDCRLLAEVYIELTGGRQRGLGLSAVESAPAAVSAIELNGLSVLARTPRPILLTGAQADAHAAFLTRLQDPVWLSA